MDSGKTVTAATGAGDTAAGMDCGGATGAGTTGAGAAATTGTEAATNAGFAGAGVATAGSFALIFPLALPLTLISSAAKVSMI